MTTRSKLRAVVSRWKATRGKGRAWLTIYDTATRNIRHLDVQGPVYRWLQDGRLFIGPPQTPRLVDPARYDR